MQIMMIIILQLSQLLENETNTNLNNTITELIYSNCTVKELLKICKYYNIEHHVKITKCKKQDIISNIIYFELLPENAEIVRKRHLMWYYMSKLLEDTKMKPYILWNN